MLVSCDVQFTKRLAVTDAASLFPPLDLLTVPPGFKKGVDFAPKGESGKALRDALLLQTCKGDTASVVPQITPPLCQACSASAVCWSLWI